MTRYRNVAGKVSDGMETIGEKLEQAGHPLKGKLLRSRTVRRGVSAFVGDHPWMVAGLILVGISAVMYRRV